MSTSKGNAGEHLVMAELLSRGFDAYWAGRGNPNYDISCHSEESGRATRLRVKTTSNGAAVWSAKKSGLFQKVQPKDDLVIICNIQNGVRRADIYVVPTKVVEQDLTRNHADYVARPGKNGKARNPDANIRVLRFFGEHQDDNPSSAYDSKYAKYREAWDLLK